MSFLGFGKPNVEKLKARRDVKRLISALRSKNSALKTEVCDALTEIGPDAVPLLSRAVAGDQPEVRIAALLTLERIPGEQAFAVITAALKNSSLEVRIAALLTLERIPGEQAFAAIKAALKNSRFEVRKEAARILSDLGDANALEELLYVPKSEMWSFTQIGSQPDRFSQEVINAAAAAVVKIGIQHFDQLLTMLRKPEVAPFAAKALGWIGDRRAVPDLLLALEPYNDIFLSESAAEALGELKDSDSVEALIDALSRGRDVAVAANKALQRITGHRDFGWSQQSEWRLWWKENKPF